MFFFTNRFFPYAVFFLLTVSACGRSVGDSCTSSADCASPQFCDTTMAEGYCTTARCLFTGCPEEAVCIEFSDFDSFCMLRCESDDDCRDGYGCIGDLGRSAFCGASVEGVAP